MALFKRRIEEAHQFKSISDAATASDVDVALDSQGATGIYKKDDNDIRFVLSNVDVNSFKKGELVFVDGGNIDGSQLSLFISGGALYYKGSAGSITRLGVA